MSSTKPSTASARSSSVAFFPITIADPPVIIPWSVSSVNLLGTRTPCRLRRNRSGKKLRKGLKGLGGFKGFSVMHFSPYWLDDLERRSSKRSTTQLVGVGGFAVGRSATP